MNVLSIRTVKDQSHIAKQSRNSTPDTMGSARLSDLVEASGIVDSERIGDPQKSDGSPKDNSKQGTNPTRLAGGPIAGENGIQAAARGSVDVSLVVPGAGRTTAASAFVSDPHM